MKRNLFNLRSLTDLLQPQMVFISEPQLFQADLPSISKYFKGEYSMFLNSEDLHFPELSLSSSRAKGGTMIMWCKDLDPYITVHPTSSPAFLPVTLDIPGWTPMIHVSSYLPTAGKETEYFTDLAAMKDSILDLKGKKNLQLRCLFVVTVTPARVI